ncbi:MAG: hypothetical protein LBR89_03375 [Holosporales bacterium]|jgi:exopolyphosphatase/guanosine-5'-triphosphate,3'-diphosphate pyrophosphatase|nr:hypothetical protein [Holosporales bacterium]
MEHNKPILKPNSKDLVLYNTRAHNPTVAAIDLGTNSCRIIVAAVNIPSLHKNYFRRLNAPSPQLKIVDAFARVIGLGEGLKQTGLLSKAAMDRTIETLAICASKAEAHDVVSIRAVATEACRQARNTDILIEKAQAQTGINLEVISPQEEAQLVLKGCMGVITDATPYGIVIDVGGGSTEVIWLRIGKYKNPNKNTFTVVDSMSLPYGVVTLRDTYEHNGCDIQIFNSASHAISQAVNFFLEKNRIIDRFKQKEVQIIASSGTVTTLASLLLKIPSYDRKLVDGKEFDSVELLQVGERLFSKYTEPHTSNAITAKELEFLLNRIGDSISDKSSKNAEQFIRARIGLLAAGTSILRAIFCVMKDHPMRIADRGVREGIIHDLVEALRSEPNFMEYTFP